MALPFHQTDPNAHKHLFDRVISRSSGYELCEFYFFRHPTLRPGFQPAQGGLLEDAAVLYPEAWAYLQTAEGRMLCTTEREWQAMTTATWATLADGTRVGWNGIGGAPFYAPDTETGALRLPDLRGMYAEAAGYDGLEVGGVHGDYSRALTSGHCGDAREGATYGAVDGACCISLDASRYITGKPVVNQYGVSPVALNSARQVPTGNANKPRAFGMVSCVYLGTPK